MDIFLDWTSYDNESQNSPEYGYVVGLVYK